MKNSSLFLSLALFVSFLNASSQPSQSLIPRPPGVDNFARYIDIPVSHYSGVPNIIVPIYTLKHKDIQVPVTLTYHSAGNRNSDQGSWVGLGWSLQPGGMITREIRDKDDLIPEHNFFRAYLPIPTVSGMITNSTICNVANYPDPNIVPTILEELTTDYKTVSKWDWAPDIYTFNINGISGKFILDQDRNKKPRIIGEKVAAQVDYISNINNDGFIVTTADGHKYYFQQKAQSYFSSDGVGSSHIFGWYLNKIISPRGDSAIFQYYNKTRATTINGVSKSKREKLNYKFIYLDRSSPEESPGGLDPYQAEAICFNDYFAYNIPGPVVKNTISSTSEPILKSITSGLSEVSFKIDSLGNSYKLESIEIKDRLNKSVVSKHHFTFGKFYDNVFREEGKLKLLSVQKEGEEPYRFEYYNNFSTKHGMGDHWGMYNGNESTDFPLINLRYYNSVTSSFTNKIFWNGANRETNPELVKAGILSTIIYPTGGKSLFEFDAHTVDNELPNISDPIVYKEYQASTPGVHVDTSFFIEGENFTGYTTTQILIEEIEFNFTDSLQWRNSDYVKNLYAIINGYKFPFAGTTNGPIKFKKDGRFIRHVAIPVPVNTNLNVEMVTPEGSTATIKIKIRYDRRRYAGGLRVKRIEYDDGNEDTKNRITSFIYGDLALLDGKLLEVKSYGKLMDRPCYYSMYSGSGEYVTGNVYIDFVICQRITMSNTNILPSVTPVVGYRKVIIKEEGNGREEKYFNCGIPSAAGMGIPGLPTYVDYKNGFLDSLKVFSEDGILRAKTINTYATTWGADNSGAVYYVDDVKAALGKHGHFQLCPEGVAGFYTYLIKSPWDVLSSVKQYVYDKQGSIAVITATAYKYDNNVHQNTTQSTIADSKGIKIINVNIYPSDYADTTGFIGELKRKFIHNVPIESVTYLENADGTKTILDGKIIEYKSDGSGVVDKEYQLKSNNIPSNSFKFSNQEMTGELPFYSAREQFEKDPIYEARVSYEYDAVHNIRTISRTDNAQTQLIWGYSSTLPIAIAENALFNQIAYADFETATDKGNWEYNISQRIYDTNDKRWCFSAELTKTGLSGSSQVGLWSKGSNIPSIGNIQGDKKYTVNGWDYYEWNVTGNVTINNNGNLIDNVRLHPVKATMTTYSYQPLIGITSSTDVNGKTSFYEYDDVGRLMLLRDNDFNILKRLSYKYSGN